MKIVNKRIREKEDELSDGSVGAVANLAIYEVCPPSSLEDSEYAILINVRNRAQMEPPKACKSTSPA